MINSNDQGKHTQGPWEVTSANRPFEYLEVMGSQDGRIVCGMEWTDNASTQARHEANARLIAAAPELLEALKEIVDSLKDTPVYSHSLAVALATIAKAEGRKS
jgi:hypothetical protein